MNLFRTIKAAGLVLAAIVLLASCGGPKAAGPQSGLSAKDIAALPTGIGPVSANLSAATDASGAENGDGDVLYGYTAGRFDFSQDGAELALPFSNNGEVLDPGRWLQFSEEAVNAEDLVESENGILRIAGDKDGYAEILATTSFVIPDESVLRIRRRVKFVSPEQMLVSALGLAESSAPMNQTRPGTQYPSSLRGLFGANYLDLPIGTGLTFSSMSDSGGKETNAPLVFGQWFDELIIYDPDADVATYSLAGEAYEFEVQRSEYGNFVLMMGNLGCGANTQTEVDQISVDFPSRESVDSSSEIAMIGNPPGFSSGAPHTIQFDISDSARSEAAIEDIGISLPPGLGSVELSLSRLTGGDGQAFDLSLESYGERIHNFDEPIALAIPLSSGGPEAGFSLVEKRAESWNGSEWVGEPFLISGDSAVIYTNHLSSFRLIDDSGMGPVVFVPDGPELPTLEQAKQAIWDAATSVASAAGNLGTFTTFVDKLPFMGELDGILGNISTLTTVFGLAADIWKGDQKALTADSLRAVSSWRLGTIGGLGAKLAGLGVFIIDYSLNSFAEGVISARSDSLMRAYLSYYRHEGWSGDRWLERIVELLRRPGNAEDYNQDIKSLIAEYLQKIWDDPGAFEDYMVRERQTAWTGDAGMSDELRVKMEAELMRITAPVINVALERARDILETEAVRARINLEYRMRELLETKTTFWVSVFGKHILADCSVVFLSGGKPVYRGTPSQVRGDFVLQLDLPAMLRAAPDEAVLYAKFEKDEELSEYSRAPISYKGRKPNGSTLVMDVTFDVNKPESTESEDLSEDDETEQDKSGEKPAAALGSAEALRQFGRLLETRDPAEAERLIASLRPSMSREGAPAAVVWLVEDAAEWSYFAADASQKQGLLYIKTAPNDDPVWSSGGSETTRLVGVAYPGDLPTGIRDEDMNNSDINLGFHGPYRSYFLSSGKLELDACYLYGIKWGPYKRYYENGQLEAEGQYVMGRKAGLWTTYHKDGALDTQGNYGNNGKKMGTWLESAYYGAYIGETYSVEYIDGKAQGYEDRDRVLAKRQAEAN